MTRKMFVTRLMPVVDDPAAVRREQPERDRDRHRDQRRRTAPRRARSGRRTSPARRRCSPGRWSRAGPSTTAAGRAASAASSGLWLVSRGARIVIPTMSAEQHDPDRRLRVARAAAGSDSGSAPAVRRRARRCGTPTPDGMPRSRRARPSGVPDPRVEDDVDAVHDEVGEEDGEREHEQQRLHERVVVAERRLLDREPDARIAEDDLDEDEAADGAREERREAGQRREDRVPRRVPASSPSGRLRPLACAIVT